MIPFLVVGATFCVGFLIGLAIGSASSGGTAKAKKPKMRLADGHRPREYVTREGRVCFVPHVGDIVTFYTRDGIQRTDASKRLVLDFEYTILSLTTENCFLLKEMTDNVQAGGWIPWCHSWKVKCPMVEDVIITPEEAKAGDSLPTPDELAKFVDKMK